MLFGEAQNIGLGRGKLGRNGDLLLVGEREGGKFPLDRFDMRSRSNA